MRQIYLDYNATTPVAPSVLEAMLPFFKQHYGNPSSGHAFGRACNEAIEDARSQVAALLGATSEEIVFTSGGTESNNLALKGVMLRYAPVVKGHLVISAIEHPSVVAPARFLERLGFRLTIVPCDENGVVSPEAVEAALRSDTVLVSVMHANNEVGVVQPIHDIAEVCRARGIMVHTDASQSAGKLRTLVHELGVDLLTLAGHKFYAPKGVGALYVREGLSLEPFMHGAGHEGGLRAGTENVPYIAGLGKASMLAARGLDDAADRLAALRDRLQDQLYEAIGSRLVVHGGFAERLPNTLSVSFPNVTGQQLLARIPELCASTGSACHASSGSMSPTLAAMRLSAEVAAGTVRLSVGWYTSEEEIDRAAELLVGAWEALQ
ncbi:MAG: cysteine desulfurase [Planctomycetales bacterium]|nr:cysteine desulfurase [Planctomycetales bacterium]